MKAKFELVVFLMDVRLKATNHLGTSFRRTLLQCGLFKMYPIVYCELANHLSRVPFNLLIFFGHV